MGAHCPLLHTCIDARSGAAGASAPTILPASPLPHSPHPPNQVDSLLLVGDPQQLPPTVRSRAAEQLGLGTSLFARLQAMGLRPMLLDTQYRCVVIVGGAYYW